MSWPNNDKNLGVRKFPIKKNIYIKVIAFAPITPNNIVDNAVIMLWVRNKRNLEIVRSQNGR
jgi:hypothetical protein